MEKMKQGIIFDFWGTLLESGVTPSVLKQTRSMMRMDNLPFSAFVTSFERSFMTRQYEGLAEAFETTFRNFNARYNPRVIEELVGLWNKNRLLAKPFPETIKVLQDLKAKNLKLAVLSNSDAFSVEPLLEKYDLAKYFDYVGISWRTGFLKTDRRAFELVLKALGLEKDDVIMVGDSIQSDIQGAQNAGIKAILIDRRNMRDFDPKIKSLEELHMFLE